MGYRDQYTVEIGYGRLLTLEFRRSYDWTNRYDLDRSARRQFDLDHAVVMRICMHWMAKRCQSRSAWRLMAELPT